MKIELTFQVSINVAGTKWEASNQFLTYEEAAEWRHKREAELFKENPGRQYIPSTLVVKPRYTEDKGV